MVGRSLALAAAALLTAAGSPALTVYRHLDVVDGTGSGVRHDMAIVVEGERIVTVEPDADYTLPAAATIVDLRGRTAIPGLIDSHVHMATPPDLARATMMLRRNLYGGVTLVRDMADDLRPVAELARESAAGEIAAPDIVFAALVAGAPFFMDPRVGASSRGWPAGAAPWMQAIDARTDIPRAVARASGTGARAIKVYADLPPGLVKRIAAEAHRQGMKVWAHAAVFPTEPADVIAADPDTVSHICYLAYQRQPVALAAYEDHTPVDEARLEAPDDPVMARLFAALRDKGIVLDATGSLFVRGDAARQQHPELPRKRCGAALTIRLTRQAWHAGVALSSGTDYVSGPDSAWPDVYAELSFLVHDVGLSPEEALRASSFNGARAAADEKERGTIAAGKLADFVVLAKSPLTDIANLRSIEMTVKHGRQYPRRDYAQADGKGAE